MSGIRPEAWRVGIAITSALVLAITGIAVFPWAGVVVLALAVGGLITFLIALSVEEYLRDEEEHARD